MPDFSHVKESLEADGYAVVPDVFDVPTQIAPVLDEYERVLTELEQALTDSGEVSGLDRAGSFTDRLIALHVAAGRDLSRHFDISLPLFGGITRHTPVHVGPAVFDLITGAGLVEVVTAVLGPEVSSHPVQKIRIKLPAWAVPAGASALVDVTPWHQDSGIFPAETDTADLLTAWVPLTPATARNGALEVVPGSHRHGAVLAHCPLPAGGVEIPLHRRPEPAGVPIEMDPGSVLLLHRRTVHRSLPNVTRDEVRISFDLRFLPTGTPTGVPDLPGFVLSSRAAPDSVVSGHAEYARTILDARERVHGRGDLMSYRWGKDHPECVA